MFSFVQVYVALFSLEGIEGRVHPKPKKELNKNTSALYYGNKNPVVLSEIDCMAVFTPHSTGVQLLWLD